MKIESVTSVAVITANPSESRRLYMDGLKLPLKQLDGKYFASEEIAGCRHFGVWPLDQAAQSCFGTGTWPGDIPVPQVSVEFEVPDADAVAAGADQLQSQGHHVLHGARQEPWGQIVARLISPEGALVGLSYAPSLHG
jgi:hypothetical protein